MWKSHYDLNTQERKLLLKCEAQKGIMICPRNRYIGQLIRFDLAMVSRNWFMALTSAGIKEARWVRERYYTPRKKRTAAD